MIDCPSTKREGAVLAGAVGQCVMAALGPLAFQRRVDSVHPLPLLPDLDVDTLFAGKISHRGSTEGQGGQQGQPTWYTDEFHGIGVQNLPVHHQALGRIGGDADLSSTETEQVLLVGRAA